MIYKKDLLIELGYSREFQEFLKKHGALLRYLVVTEYRRCNGPSTPHSREHFLISGAFIWSITEEGIDYWKNLDILWQKQNN